MKTMRPHALSRREFLKTSGTLVVGFAMSPAVLAASAEKAPVPGDLAPDPAKLDSWLAISRDGTVTVFTEKLELGMGVSTGLAQIAAEELDVPIRSVAFVMGDSARVPYQAGTAASLSIQGGGNPVRHAAAEARHLLLGMASTRLGAPPDQLTVRDGVVSRTDDPSKSVSYGDLIGGRRFDVTLKSAGAGFFVDIVGGAQPKSPSQYKIVGTSVPRIDIPDKATGRFTYIVDVRVPGMLHGRVIRPAPPGASFLSVDPQSVQGARVVRKGNFVGVVAETEWAAIQAAQDLKVTWSSSKMAWPAMANLYKAMWALPVHSRHVLTQQGDVDAAMASSARTIEARYEWPFISHAMMGPSCAVVDVRNGGATVWTSSQHPIQLQDGLAELLRLPRNKVHVIWVEGSGSYGRPGPDDAAGDAALLSQAVGRPVRVQWMRADETAWAPKGPPIVVAVKAGLSDKGEMVAWDYVARDFSGRGISPQPSRASNLLPGHLIGFPADNIDEPANLQETYTFANKRKVGEVVPWLQEASPLRTSYLRAPGQVGATFGGESFIDEVAAALRVDPVAFRLLYIKEPRAIAVVQAAAKQAGWVSRSSPRPKLSRSGLVVGRGVAYAPRGNTRVATVAEVEVNQATGQVHVTRLVTAHEAWVTGGLGAEIAATVAERALEGLLAPPIRVGAEAVPIPSGPLRQHALPNAGTIARALRHVVAMD